MLLVISQTVHLYGARAVSCSGPAVWNSLNLEYHRDSLSVNVSGRYLTTFLFARYCFIRLWSETLWLLLCSTSFIIIIIINRMRILINVYFVFIFFDDNMLHRVWSGAGPLASMLVNQFGCRPVVILGSIISTFGFVVSRFSNSINTLTFSYGFIGGERPFIHSFIRIRLLKQLTHINDNGRKV